MKLTRLPPDAAGYKYGGQVKYSDLPQDSYVLAGKKFQLQKESYQELQKE